MIKKFIRNVMKDSLYRNSIYLMVNTLVMAGFGFFFWIIVARLYSPENVGLATALISVMGLIAGLSVMGLNIGLIRYLPKSKDKNLKINTSFTLVIISTIIFTSVFLMFSKYLAPKLMFVHDNIILSFVFIIFMIIATCNSLIESIFIAYRNTKFVLVKNTIFSVIKMMIPFFLVVLGAYGIFSSWMIAMFVGLLVSIFVLIFRFEYRPKFEVRDSIIKEVGRYSLGNYFAGFIGSLPTLILPLLVLNQLGAEQSAYYYISMMIAGILFTIPQSTSNSLFAEGSWEEGSLSGQVKKAVKIIGLLLVPAIVLVFLFGNYILLVFGAEYSAEGFGFLKLMAVSGVFVGVNSIYNSVFKVQKRIREILYRNIIGVISILAVSYLFIEGGRGLLGVGYAYMIGQAIMMVFFVVSGFKRRL